MSANFVARVRDYILSLGTLHFSEKVLITMVICWVMFLSSIHHINHNYAVYSTNKCPSSSVIGNLPLINFPLTSDSGHVFVVAMVLYITYVRILWALVITPSALGLWVYTTYAHSIILHYTYVCMRRPF